MAGSPQKKEQKASEAAGGASPKRTEKGEPLVDEGIDPLPKGSTAFQPLEKVEDRVALGHLRTGVDLDSTFAHCLNVASRSNGAGEGGFQFVAAGVLVRILSNPETPPETCLKAINKSFQYSPPKTMKRGGDKPLPEVDEPDEPEDDPALAALAGRLGDDEEDVDGEDA